MRYRLTLAAAAGTALASTALYALFDGLAWFWAGVGAIALVAGIGVATRLRPLPVIACVLAELAGLVLYLNVLFASARSWLLVVPSFSSLSYLAQLTTQGMTDADRFSPPVPLTPGLMLLSTAGIGLAALATDTVAVRLRSSAVAGLALLALFIVPSTTPAARSGLGTTIVFCLGTCGYLLILAADGRERIQRWGRTVSLWRADAYSRNGMSRAPGRPRTSEVRALASAGRRVGAASIVVALCVPLFVPGFRVNRMFPAHVNIFGPAASALGGNGSGVPNPLAVMSQDLREAQPQVVLTYRSTDQLPQYLQMYTLGDLSTTAWTMGPFLGRHDHGDRQAGPAPGPDRCRSHDRDDPGRHQQGGGQRHLGDELPAGAVPGHRDQRAGALGEQRGHVHGGGVRYLAVWPELHGHQRRHRPDGAAADQGTGPAGRHRRRVPQRPVGVPLADRAGQEGDRQCGDPLRQGHRAAELVRRFGPVQLQPERDRAAGRERAEPLPHREQARVLPAVRLRDGRAGPAARHPLARRDRLHRGHPDRDQHLGGQDQRRARLARALLPGAGWLRFEPTPTGSAGQGTATPPTYTVSPTNPGGGSTVTSPAVGQSGTGTSGAKGGGANYKAGSNRFTGEGTGSGAVTAGTGFPWGPLGFAVLALLAVVAVAPRAARSVRRQSRLLRGGEADRTHGIWREVLDDLADYRLGPRPNESPRAVARRVAIEACLTPPAAAALSRAALAEERARYASTPSADQPGRGDLDVIRRGLAASADRRTRWRARLFPASAFPPVRAGFAQLADAAARAPSGRSRPRLWRRDPVNDPGPG